MDTRDKRASAVLVGSPWRTTLPVADGALNQADRQHVALAYRGILAGAVIVAAARYTLTLNIQRNPTLTLAKK